MDPVSDYYGMEMWKRMLGIGNNPYQPSRMQYVGMGGQPGQQRQQQGGGMQNQMLKQLMSGTGTTATGMTPNATNAMGESYYGWGAQTGDWGTMATVPEASGGLMAGGDIGGSSIPLSEMGADLGASAGGEGMGLGTLGTYAGYIGAAIAGQHVLNKMTDRRFDGQATKDMFGGSGATEPWLAFAYQKLGIDSPTTGESLDAAVHNKDWGKVAEGIPSHAAYYMDPIRNMGADFVSDKVGGTAGDILGGLIFPEGFAAKQLGKLFGGLF